MVPPKLLIGICLLACGAGLILSLNGWGACNGTNVTPPGKIEHVVILFQENRTPDNLFQDPVLIAKGADIATSGVNSKGTTIQLTPLDLGTTGSSPQNYDLIHAHSAFVPMYDGGKIDGADLIGCTPAIDCPPNAHPNPQFKYVLPSDVQPYFALAEQYTFGDRMFQTNQGPSMPAHQYIISGTSWTGPGTAGNFFAAENPEIGPNGARAAGANTGCTSPPNETIFLIDAPNPNPDTNETTTTHPCFEHATLTDLMHTQQRSC